MEPDTKTTSGVRVVQIANRHAPFPVSGYGGIERVVSVLHDALPATFSVGIPGSSGERVVVAERASVDALIDAAVPLTRDADLVLVHHPEMVESACEAFGASRVVEMLHVPVQDPDRFTQSAHHVVGVSSDQLADVWVRRPDALVCWHGTPVSRLGQGDGGYGAWVGRFMPEKGPVEAIRAARLAGVPLKLAGLATGGSEHGYFENEVRPLLGGDVEWVGPVTTDERDELLRGAAALLVPTRWREAFGLTVIEAAMVGTPVLGYPAGATRELLETGIGTVCHGVEDLAEGLVRAVRKEHDRVRIGEIAREWFSPDAQAARLREIFRRWCS